MNIGGKDAGSLSSDNKAYLRMREIGFVFQAFYLNSKLKAFENVMLPMYINSEIKPDERKPKAFELLDKFSLSDRSMHYPGELSAGEQQRVAIARALANSPNFILADEPTGNLDKDNERIVLDTLKDLTKENRAVVVVSHNEIVKEYADVLYHMDNGMLRRQL
jgi:ABC-type lipoprotein export system ATPase subunit